MDIYGEQIDKDRNTLQNATLGRFRPRERAALDFYETPPEAVQALAALDISLFDYPILEPCAGNGAISKILKKLRL